KTTMDMPVKHKKPSIAAQAAAREARLPKLPENLLDGLVDRPMSAMEVEDLIDAFGKAVIERAMGAEMNMHLGYRAGEDKPAEQTDERNGVSSKTLLTKRGSMRVQLPRDRDGSFEPVLIPKHERHFAGFDERIIALYARGMSVREIQAFLLETYATDVSPELISEVTDAADARAIWTAVQQPEAHEVAIKTEVQQSVLALHRLRAQLMKFRIMQTNALRGLLY